MPKKFETLPYTFHTKLACEIAEIDPQRLNESIAAKDGYKCAPETRKGKKRTYGEFDLIALYLFRFLTTLGYSQSLASKYACGVLTSLNSSHHELPDRLDFPLNPFPDVVIGCSSEEPTIFEHSGNLVSYATLGFNLPAIRHEIRRRMENVADRERNTFGNED